mmetsp:Transcript_18065/g.68233  ORF Transcript_18065/g.68233 Transcript_18065/m.68233 type:complete len:609 (+) Transcript_18065:703-2529(+)
MDSAPAARDPPSARPERPTTSSAQSPAAPPSARALDPLRAAVSITVQVYVMAVSAAFASASCEARATRAPMPLRSSASDICSPCSSRAVWATLRAERTIRAARSSSVAASPSVMVGPGGTYARLQAAPGSTMQRIGRGLAKTGSTAMSQRSGIGSTGTWEVSRLAGRAGGATKRSFHAGAVEREAPVPQLVTEAESPSPLSRSRRSASRLRARVRLSCREEALPPRPEVPLCALAAVNAAPALASGLTVPRVRAVPSSSSPSSSSSSSPPPPPSEGAGDMPSPGLSGPSRAATAPATVAARPGAGTSDADTPTHDSSPKRAGQPLVSGEPPMAPGASLTRARAAPRTASRVGPSPSVHTSESVRSSADGWTATPPVACWERASPSTAARRRSRARTAASTSAAEPRRAAASSAEARLSAQQRSTQAHASDCVPRSPSRSSSAADSSRRRESTTARAIVTASEAAKGGGDACSASTRETAAPPPPLPEPAGWPAQLLPTARSGDPRASSAWRPWPALAGSERSAQAPPPKKTEVVMAEPAARSTSYSYAPSSVTTLPRDVRVSADRLRASRKLSSSAGKSARAGEVSMSATCPPLPGSSSSMASSSSRS